jgi:GTP-binding protein HflX
MLERDSARPSQAERCILIGAITREQSEEKSTEYLDELRFLAYTAGAETVEVFTQKLDRPDSGTFLGSGKMEEIKEFIQENGVDLAIFDDELSPSQLKNIERLFEIKVMDRTNLILDIFAARAQTSYARTQVELAQYEYLLPRLTRMWTHLERQKGGIGMRGPGETQIETDRRIIKQKIALLREKLVKIDRQMATQRGNRGTLIRASLVGYTNVGKSTLMNALGKTEVLAENKLFATLDTTVRKIVIGNLPFLLTDTVGFIRKLPTQLVESFKSTLDEVRESDILFHVVDISHESYEDHMASVNQILTELKAHEKPILVIFNKVDAWVAQPDEEGHVGRIEDLQNRWIKELGGQCVFISATNKDNFDSLRESIYRAVATLHAARFPFDTFLY